MNKREATAARKAAIKNWAHLLIVGARFNTPFEEGCIVTEAPDEFGSFAGLDSEGVECGYDIIMVTEVYS